MSDGTLGSGPPGPAAAVPSGPSDSAVPPLLLCDALLASAVAADGGGLTLADVEAELARVAACYAAVAPATGGWVGGGDSFAEGSDSGIVAADGDGDGSPAGDVSAVGGDEGGLLCRRSLALLAALVSMRRDFATAATLSLAARDRYDALSAVCQLYAEVSFAPEALPAASDD